MKLPLFKPGRGRPSPWSAGDLNRIVEALNRILALRIVRHNKEDRVAIEPSGMVLYLRSETPAGETGRAESARPRKVRVRVCDPETGKVEEYEVEGRQIS